MLFRPFPILTAIAIPALAILVGLGVWQVQRAQWKTDLIRDFDSALAAEPATLDQALCPADALPIGHVIAAPEARGLQLRVFGHNTKGDPGYRLFQAVHPGCAGPTGGMLAETGFEPLQIGGQIGGAPLTAPATAADQADKFIFEAWPVKPMMAAVNTPEANDWHWFDGPAMSAFLGAGPLDQRYILARLDGLPDYLSRTPPSGHIGYAVTWFGMAVAFAVIYGLFHARAGRLRFRKPKTPPDQAQSPDMKP